MARLRSLFSTENWGEERGASSESALSLLNYKVYKL